MVGVFLEQKTTNASSSAIGLLARHLIWASCRFGKIGCAGGVGSHKCGRKNAAMQCLPSFYRKWMKIYENALSQSCLFWSNDSLMPLQHVLPKLWFDFWMFHAARVFRYYVTVALFGFILNVCSLFSLIKQRVRNLSNSNRDKKHQIIQKVALLCRTCSLIWLCLVPLRKKLNMKNVNL